MTLGFVILSAFLLDWIFGDPLRLPHPICFIGKFISKGEPLARKLFTTGSGGEFIGGMILTIVTVGLAFMIPFVILMLAGAIHSYLKVAIEIFMCYQIIATKCLGVEAMKVANALKNTGIEAARSAIAMLVGRDTQSLESEGVCRATVETVAENTTDGVIAPLFFMLIGGAPLAFAYKAVNTLDSMIGYRNEKYLYFGRFAARLDDVANFIPARLAAFFLMFAAFVPPSNAKNAWQIYLRDRRKHKSPNSAQTESVVAGALGIQLAGNAYYFGELHEKPTIGDALRPIEVNDIERSVNLMYLASMLFVVSCTLLRVILF